METGEMPPSQRGNEPIAIIGSGCRLPGGSNSPSALWELLREPRDVLCQIPPSRFDVRGFYHEDSQFPGHTNVKHSYLLQENIARFDAAFFNITPTEAMAMDPQQRLLLETVYEAMEAAGLTIQGLKGSDTGVYVGQMYGDYEALQYRDLHRVPTYHGLGVARSIVSNRISYFFDWHGPSLTVDTACSSSLVAVHQAVQALRAGDVRVAVAAGTNLLLGPEPYIYESKLKMLSPEGRSRMWDKDANGYARGDGVAAIMLKTVSAALADGDAIECIIRETGVNQDGRSRGITMPRAAAQAALIRATYERAGLDLTRDSHRCQYFEAHGTGTPAGDPVEAEAVHTAFFGHRENHESFGPKLLVGSIKTIIGHTESTAGLAGILKVSQALQHGQVPPNLLFNTLNPAIEPFYLNLEIPRKLTPWPDLPQGSCRRASVNSFGFGGTNAHVILESLERTEPTSRVARSGGAQADENHENETRLTPLTPLTPFVFSAQSKPSLVASLGAYASFLQQHPDTNLRDLAWSLQTRRSRLPFRIHFSSPTHGDLLSHVRQATKNLQLGPRSTNAGDDQREREARVLGLFTGQGAQWARMGAELIETSALASEILSDLDEALGELPESDRPAWHLRGELLAHASSSNIGQAAISQPLCTAIQIILVQVLRAAGIKFSSVVGHSSGEIAAAFAAGYLSSKDAICIAYYRGFHAHLAAGPNGVNGAMLAVGTTLEDAENLCSDEEFSGRIRVAACNSRTSVTLSGDEDAVSEMADILEDEGKFVRRLQVDTAYHSHHMDPCSQPYHHSIGNMSTSAPSLGPNCSWFSSVYPDRKPEDMAYINTSYWVENMRSPVLFRQALENAIASGPFDAAIEVGPHPALKGPARDIMEALQIQIPYTGTLQRKCNPVHSMSDTLGYVWSCADNSSVDFERYEKSFGHRPEPQYLPGLPVYRWNHGQEYWNESIASRDLRQRTSPVHLLLGDLMSGSSSSHQLSWSHVLRPKDVPWIHGHRIQGQTVFPAAGYVVTALETIPFLAINQEVQLVELEDLAIHQAMVFDNEDQESGIEVRCTVCNIDRSNPSRIAAKFIYESCTAGASSFHLVADGKLLVHLGNPSPHILPAGKYGEFNLIDVPEERFYSTLKDIGYEYADSFKALTNLRRSLGRVSGSVNITALKSNGQTLAVHPAVLDAAFHSVLLAVSYPGDGELWSLHLPTHVRRVRVNPSLCGAQLIVEQQVPFVASLPSVSRQENRLGFEGDVEIRDPAGISSAIQVEGLKVVPFTPATGADDEQKFYSMQWIDAEPDAAASGTCQPTDQERKLSDVLERGSFFYLGQLESKVPVDCPGRDDEYFAAYINYARHTIKQCEDGRHRYAKQCWLQDTEQDILEMAQSFSGRPEIKAMFAVGEHMHRSIRGETTMLEHLIMNGILDDYYARALSMAQMTPILADSVAQVIRRYPTRKILEVGAGTGGATRQILQRIGDEFATYTFTDVSAGFFDKAQSEFSSHGGRMTYSVLDLEQDMKSQGFEDGTYDIVVASLVIHATKNLEQTLRRIRRLLKPGGYLIACEITNADVIRVNALFGCLPGWWQGMDDGRTLGAAVNETQWDLLLRNAGLSGIDSISSVQDSMAFPTSVFISQAVNDWVDFIREPLVAGPMISVERSIIKKLLIVGGATFQVSRLVEGVQKLIRPFCGDMVRLQSLETMDEASVTPDSTVLMLEDLDHHVFEDLTNPTFQSLKQLLGSEKTVLWVTQNRRTDNPYASMPVGFARTALWEVPELRLQFLDFEETAKIDPRTLVESLLRFQTLASSQERNQHGALFSVESEIIVTSDGRNKIQRMRPVRDANDRYNSARRPMEKIVSLKESSVMLTKKDVGYIVKEVSIPSTSANARDEDLVNLEVTHATLRAIRTSAGDLFVVIGECARTGAQYVTVTHSVRPSMMIRRSRLHLSPVPSQFAVGFLRHVAAELAMKPLLTCLGACKTVMMHNTPPELATHVQQSSNNTGINITFTTTSRHGADHQNWTYIDPHSRSSLLGEILPLNTSACVDWTLPERPSGLSIPNLTSSFGRSSMKIIGVDSVFPGTTCGRFPDREDPVADAILKSALDEVLDTIPSHMYSVSDFSSVHINDVMDNESPLDALTIVDWGADSVKVIIQPAQTELKPDRSYWLVGLSGSMGLSLADWMIDHGASNLVISSRRPNISKYWLDAAARRGARVRVVSCDVTDLRSLRMTYDEIRRTAPPLAGVAQGAMVLKDMAIRDMGLEDLVDVVRPKVAGSLNLDLLLRDEALDFFVFFSSLATVAGNPGQASYTAANAFMSGLAQQRRRRGAAASVMDLGPVIGTGVITRGFGHDVSAALADRGLVGVSELDVHQMFAEAINSSNPASTGEWQMATTFRKIPESAPNRPLWYDYPQFACFTLQEATTEVNSPGKEANVSVKDQLANAKSTEDVGKVITDSFTRELRKMLRLGDDYDLATSLRTDELGLDSLVAVRVRSWFLNNFHVNIPALRILMGASIQDLILQALEGIPPELTPMVSAGRSPDSESDKLVPNKSSQSSLRSMDGGDSENGVTPPSTYAQTEAMPVEDTPLPSPSPGSAKHDEMKLQRTGQVSFTQSVFLFVHELLKDKSTLNNTGMLHLKGEIRIPDLSRAVRTMGTRHEALRTCIRAIDGRISQGVLQSSRLVLEHQKIRTPDEMIKVYAALRNHVFDLSSGYTSRVILLSLSPKDHFLLVASHHIIFDRTSTGIFLKDLERMYDGGVRGTPDPLQYLDYSNAQYEEYESGHWKRNIEFWRAEFCTIPDPLPLHRSQAIDRRPLEQYTSHIIDFRVDQKLSERIRQLARDHKSTSFHVYLAAFGVLLHRFLGVKDVCIGIADSCRTDDRTLTGVGPFLNMIPLRVDIAGGQSIGNGIIECRKKAFEVLSHALPFEVILNELQVIREPTHPPLAQAFLNYADKSTGEDQAYLGCQMEAMREDQAELPYDIALTVINNTSGDTRIIMNVQASLYSEQQAKIIAHGFEDILNEFVQDPKLPVGDDWRFRRETIQKALVVGRGKSLQLTWPQTVVHRFEEIVSSSGQHDAVVDDEGNSLTYEDLSKLIDRLAAEMLLRNRVKRGHTVAVFQKPTVSWAVSVLAIMKIGAVYVPLDVATPVPRLSLMCNDCKPAAILVNEYTVNRVQELSFSQETPIIDVANIPKPQNDVMIPTLAQAGAAAVILYTSGSTGIPKAVVLQHTSLVQEIEHCARTYKLENHDVVLQQSAWSFDLSVSQMFVALCVGARLQIVSHTMRPDPDSIIHTISRHGITATYATPTEYKSWLARDRKMIASMSAWRLALVAGEPVTRDLLQLFRGLNRKDVRLFNIYGPTETTCGSTKMELRYQDPELGQCGIIPVGWASVNEAVYILDSNQNLQPIGQTGEVVIGGVGVSLGYLNDAESTRAAFLSNPFATSEDISRGWTTMYRTGDLGYLQPDGSLILKGRVAGDTEIKLNGVRINLAEIEETVLLSADGAISDAVACLRSSSKHGDTQFVVVYVVFNCNSALGSDRSSFLQRLLQNLPLPSTTRPSALAPVQEIPRSLSGKVDRKALSKMPLPPMDSDLSRPSGMLHRELLLRTIWEQVIPDELVQLGRIDAETDFFSVGGSSLLLIQLQNKLEELLQISVPLLQLFQASTLRSMARLLANVEELEEHTRDAEQIDWNQETMIMADLFAKEVSPGPPANLPSVPPRVIVLTGATGFLGRHLVEALLDEEHVNKVICIAVRNLSFDATYPMELKSKLEFYQGDLTLPQLGLDDAAVSQIFGVADAVIHNGADVSHLKTYASLRKANFVSTQELVKMCLSRNVPLHYISTTGVSMYTSSETMAPVSVRHSHPPMDGHYGYIASKWASEVFLENVQDKYGLPVVIHRPSSIIRPESDMAGDDPAADVVQNMLLYSRRISAVPAAMLELSGTLDLVRPETVSQRVIEAVMGPSRQSDAGGITYIHESGDVELRICSMREHIQKATGGPVGEIPLDEWLLLAKAQGLSDSMASVFEGIGSGEGLNFPQLVTGGHGEPLFPNQS